MNLDTRYIPDAMDFLAAFGVRAYIDLDDELIFDYENRDISIAELVQELSQYQWAVRNMVMRRAERDRERFMGGPLDGQSHRYAWARQIFAHRVSRAKWASYSIFRDGRGIFRGYATSEKKARQLAWKSLPETEKHL